MQPICSGFGGIAGAWRKFDFAFCISASFPNRSNPPSNALFSKPSGANVQELFDVFWFPAVLMCFDGFVGFLKVFCVESDEGKKESAIGCSWLCLWIWWMFLICGDVHVRFSC